MLGKILGAVGRVLITAGLVVLGFVVYQLWGTSLEQARGQNELTSVLAAEAEKRDQRVDASTLDASDIADEFGRIEVETAPALPPPPQGEALGVIEIPKIGLERVIVEGVSTADLKKGPGRYPGTAMPGQAGNTGIAGHRTTYGAPFNRIDELVPGDEIRVSTLQGRFTYEVVPAPGQTTQAWYAVSPSQVEVLADVGVNQLTLTACHPKYSARERIIVHAHLKEQPAPSPPPSAIDGGQQARATIARDFDEGLEGDPSALSTSLLFGGGAAAVMILAWLMARQWKPGLIYAVSAPAVLVLIWFGYVYMDRFLPAL